MKIRRNLFLLSVCILMLAFAFGTVGCGTSDEDETDALPAGEVEITLASMRVTEIHPQLGAPVVAGIWLIVNNTNDPVVVYPEAAVLETEQVTSEAQTARSGKVESDDITEQASGPLGEIAPGESAYGKVVWFIDGELSVEEGSLTVTMKVGDADWTKTYTYDEWIEYLAQ